MARAESYSREKESTSTLVGGRPVRSYDRRRSSASPSAAGFGRSPFSSSLAAGLVGKPRQLDAAGAGRSGRTHLDPLLDEADLGGRQLRAGLAGRHRDIGVALVDRDDDERFLEVARDDGRPEVAAGEHALAGIHDEAALGDALLLRVTFVATLGEDRPDVLLEEFEAGRIHLRLGADVGGGQHGGRAQRGQRGEQAERIQRGLHGQGER
jgi:hypothetical protein